MRKLNKFATLGIGTSAKGGARWHGNNKALGNTPLGESLVWMEEFIILQQIFLKK